MSLTTRGRPVIIDKITLTVPESDTTITAQFVGKGSVVQIDLPGMWKIVSYNAVTSRFSDLPITLQQKNSAESRPPRIKPVAASMPLFDAKSPLKLIVRTDKTFGLLCDVVYPTGRVGSPQWALSAFDRSSIGEIGRTKLTLTLDRDLTPEEVSQVLEQIQTRRGRSTR